MSDHELSAGTRWASEVAVALGGSSMGIVCLTPDNVAAPWLLFEAGALSRSVDEARVVPYLFNLKQTDVPFHWPSFRGLLLTRTAL